MQRDLPSTKLLCNNCVFFFAFIVESTAALGTLGSAFSLGHPCIPLMPVPPPMSPHLPTCRSPRFQNIKNRLPACSLDWQVLAGWLPPKGQGEVWPRHLLRAGKYQTLPQGRAQYNFNRHFFPCPLASYTPDVLLCDFFTVGPN